MMRKKVKVVCGTEKREEKYLRNLQDFNAYISVGNKGLFIIL